MISRAALVVLFGLVAACGSDRVDDDSAGTTVTPTVTDPVVTTGPQPIDSTTQPTTPRPPVGSVLEVVTPGGDVDGQTAESGDAIRQAGVVTTEAAGKIHFSVAEKIESCILRAQGQAIVVPGDGPLVRLARGEATCRTSSDGGSVQIDAGGVQIVVSDPVFRLAVDESGGLAGVGVAQGAVSVDGELLVGGQQAAWSGGLGDRQSVQMDADLAILGESLPPVVYDTPGQGASPTWDAALGSGVLTVQVVQPGGGPISELAASLLGPFGDVLDARVGIVETDESPDLVAGSLVDNVGLILTSEPVDGLPTVLLFEAGGSSWYVQAQPGDDAIAAALQDYVAGTLQGPCPTGPGEVAVQAGEAVCYVERYQRAYPGDEPATVPIDQFAGLLGL